MENGKSMLQVYLYIEAWWAQMTELMEAISWEKECESKKVSVHEELNFQYSLPSQALKAEDVGESWRRRWSHSCYSAQLTSPHACECVFKGLQDAENKCLLFIPAPQDISENSDSHRTQD